MAVYIDLAKCARARGGWGDEEMIERYSGVLETARGISAQHVRTLTHRLDFFFFFPFFFANGWHSTGSKHGAGQCDFSREDDHRIHSTCREHVHSWCCFTKVRSI